MFGFPTEKPTYAFEFQPEIFLEQSSLQSAKVLPDAKAEVERALKDPIPVGSKRLSEIAKAESKVAIVVDDATRKTPSEMMLLPVLAELNLAGVKDENITIIFGCGTHRAVKPEEATAILGAEVIKRIKAVSHDCKAHRFSEFWHN